MCNANGLCSSFSDGTSTGILVSQLEVSFSCIAACVPTVIKITEEIYTGFCVSVLRLEPNPKSLVNTVDQHLSAIRRESFPLSSLDEAGQNPQKQPGYFTPYQGDAATDYVVDVSRTSVASGQEVRHGAIEVTKEVSVS